MMPGEIHAAAVARAEVDPTLRVTCDVCEGRTTTRTVGPDRVSTINTPCPRCRGRGWRPTDNDTHQETLAMQQTPKPTVGRTVHYHSFGTPGGEFKPLPRAAIITETHAENPDIPDDGTVAVCVLNPGGVFFNRVSFSETPKPGHWNWPPRGA